jgi:hypothetical protein
MVIDDVMADAHQTVLILPDADQEETDQGQARQVEWSPAFLMKKGGCPLFGIRRIGKIQQRNRQCERGPYGLQRPSIHGRKGGAQDFVPSDEIIDASPKCFNIERSSDPVMRNVCPARQPFWRLRIPPDALLRIR